MAGESEHPDSSIASVSQPHFFSRLTILDLTIGIKKDILCIANNIRSECEIKTESPVWRFFNLRNITLLRHSIHNLFICYIFHCELFLIWMRNIRQWMVSLFVNNDFLDGNTFHLFIGLLWLCFIYFLLSRDIHLFRLGKKKCCTNRNKNPD